jgi:hypothetical protein
MSPVTKPVAPPAPVGPISAAVDAAHAHTFWLAVAALVLVAVTAVVTARLATEDRRRIGRLERSVRALSQQLAAARERVEAAHADSERLEAEAERLRSLLLVTGAQMAGERARSDHLFDLLAALPPVDVVVAEHYVPAEGHG